MAKEGYNKGLIDSIFGDKSEDFIDGFEIGKIYFLLKNKKVIDELKVIKSNQDIIRALCRHFGYTHKLSFKNGSVGTLMAFPAITSVN